MLGASSEVVSIPLGDGQRSGQFARNPCQQLCVLELYQNPVSLHSTAFVTKALGSGEKTVRTCVVKVRFPDLLDPDSAGLEISLVAMIDQDLTLRDERVLIQVS